MKPFNKNRVNELISIVNNKIQGLNTVALIDENRAYGGIIRAAKGKLLEEFCRQLVIISWSELDGKPDDLSFSDVTIPIPLNKKYINTIKSPIIKQWIIDNYPDFIFRAQVDVHVMIRESFVLGIECKAYTENAMLKRILVDFTLLKSQFPDLKCGLLQFESQLTGDYSQIDQDILYGSRSSHTLMSYFDVDLNIMTLLKGERKVDEPIHKEGFFKPLEIRSVERVIENIKSLLSDFL